MAHRKQEGKQPKEARRRLVGIQAAGALFRRRQAQYKLKVFWFFFSKKELLSFRVMTRPSPRIIGQAVHGPPA
jgi:hypothetical protein